MKTGLDRLVSNEKDIPALVRRTRVIYLSFFFFETKRGEIGQDLIKIEKVEKSKLQIGSVGSKQ